MALNVQPGDLLEWVAEGQDGGAVSLLTSLIHRFSLP
jgi:hypothetical protein